MIKNRNILLIEDDEDDQIFFIDAMQEINGAIDVKLAKNGAEALTQLTHSRLLPNLIFMDLTMPVMGGFECLTHIKTHPILRNIPIAILTTSRDIEEKQFALAQGARFFLVKPNAYFGLRQTLTEVMTIVTSEWNATLTPVFS